MNGISITIDLWDSLCNMEIGLCWYQNENGLVWTHNLSNHLIIELEIIIASGSMTHIVETNLYELHPMDYQGFNDK